MFMQMWGALLLYNLVNQPNEVIYKMSVFTVRCVLKGVTNSVSPAALQLSAERTRSRPHL